jgi:hypothetical protein
LSLAALQVTFSILIHFNASMRYVSEQLEGSINTAIEQQTPTAEAGSTAINKLLLISTFQEFREKLELSGTSGTVGTIGTVRSV